MSKVAQVRASLEKAVRTTSLSHRLLIPLAAILALGIGSATVVAAAGLGPVVWIPIAAAMLVALTALAHVAIRIVLRPLEQLTRTAKSFASGDLSPRAASSETDLGRLGRYLNVMVDRHKVALDKVETANLQLHGILESLPLEISLFDAQRRYLFRKSIGQEDASDEKLSLGMTPPELWEHRGLDPLLGEEIDAAIVKCIDTGEPVSLEQNEVSESGEVRTFSRVLTPVRGRGEDSVRVIGYGSDVTEQRLAESALRDRELQLQQAQKMESVGRLAGGIAHDFNNLLTSILGFVDIVLLDQSLSPEAREDLSEVQRSAAQAKDLTRQLLAYSRKQIIKPEALDVAQEIQGTERMLRRLIGERIELSSKHTTEPTTVEMDPGQLNQILTNLVVNARDAMPNGGALTIETSVLELRDSPSIHESFDPGRYVLVAIRDTGTGMNQATRAQIFEPFFTTKEVNEGTGLGLSTVYGIVSQNGGYITVDSELGLGSTFKVYLPYAWADGERAADAADSSLARGQGTVLVAEDQPSVRRLVQRTLESCGYRVLLAPDGATAVEIERERRGEIDVFLTDVVMPGMTGPETAQKILAASPEIRVIYMTAYPFEALGRQMVLDGDVCYLEKPFEATQLSEMVKSVMARAADESRPAVAGSESVTPSGQPRAEIG